MEGAYDLGDNCKKIWALSKRERGVVADQRPVIIYCTSGLNSAIYTIWSIRSLQQFDYEPIEVIVGSAEEKTFIEKHLPGQKCHAAEVDLGSFRGFSFKAFSLAEYYPQAKDRNIVVCDADILFTSDPAPLFEKYRNQFWFHKLNPLDPAAYDLAVSEVSPARWSSLTLLHYRDKMGFKSRPPWILNSGLFLVKREWYEELMRLWAGGIRELGPELMLNDQSMLTVAASKMNLEPIVDRDAGNATAKHYLSTLKPQLVEAAIEAGYDHDNLAPMVVLPKEPGLMSRLFNYCKRRMKRILR